MADATLDAVQQLRAAVEEQGREIQRLLGRHTQLEQQLQGLEGRAQAPEAEVTEPGRPSDVRLSLESVKSATPAKAGAPQPVAEPLSKRLAKAMPQLRESQQSAQTPARHGIPDVCVDAINLLDDVPEEEGIDEEEEEDQDQQMELQKPQQVAPQAGSMFHEGLIASKNFLCDSPLNLRIIHSRSLCMLLIENPNSPSNSMCGGPST